MNREELIKKWLDNNLNSQEQKAFELLEDYNDLIQIDTALKSFKAPHFSVDESYNALTTQLNTGKHATWSWIRPILKVAAIVAICFSVYYYTTTLDSEINTQIAEHTTIQLPDDSTVELNANSLITFNEKSWAKNREVYLLGEAFFKVAKGKKFDVVTDQGTISVLGTQFNVKQRKGYFEVTCYEGLVAVNHNKKITKLNPGQNYRIIDGKLFADEKEIITQPNPTWLRGESSFYNTPLKYVISELENQYNTEIIVDKSDTSRLFTGSFTHKNLDLALQSVTIPLNLSYSKSGNSIVLKRE